MNLLKPGTGDMLDRLTILARKIVERPERKDLEAEYCAITRQVPISIEMEQCAHLAALNAAIWQREDVIRNLKGVGAYTNYTAQIAFEIQDLNDRRAALIAEINGTPSEKLYKP